MSERAQSPEPTTPPRGRAVPSEDPTTSLAHYLAPLRQYRIAVLLVTVVVTALGLLLAVAGPRTYTSTTSVLIYPVSADPTEALQAADRSEDMATELWIAESRAVAEMAAAELGELGIDIGPGAAASSISVTNPQDSRVLNVSYRSSDPAVARVGSELATSAYLGYRSELNAASRQVARTTIDDEISVLQDRLSDVQERLELTAADSSARLIVEVEKTSIEGELEAQQRALADLSTLSIDAATVFDTAREPSSADGLTVAQLLIGSLAGGLVLGVFVAWMLAALRVEGNTDRLHLQEGADGPHHGPDADADAEADDADDPFDDSDNRDPLQLLKDLDAVESDPRIALATISDRRRVAEEQATADEPGPAEIHESSFAELYPNDFSGGGDVAAEFDGAPEATTDEPAGELLLAELAPPAAATEVEAATPGSDGLDESASDDAGFGVAAQPLAEFDAAADLSTTVEHEVEIEDGDDDAPPPIDDPVVAHDVDGTVAPDAHDGIAPDTDTPDADDTVALDTDAPDTDAPDTDAPDTEAPDADGTVALDTDAPDPDGDVEGDVWQEPAALRGLADLDTTATVVQLPALTPPSERAPTTPVTIEQTGRPDADLLPQLAAIADGLAAQAEAEAAEFAAAVADELDGHEGEPTIADEPPLVDPFEAAYDAAEIGLEYASSENGDDQAVEDAEEAVDASLTTGDPNELDPGPPSWDGPFVGPTTWEQLSAMAAAAEASAPAPESFAAEDHLTPESDPAVAGDVDHDVDPDPEPVVDVEPIPEAVAVQPAQPELVAGNDVDTLFEQLADLGSAGPVAVLSLSDRNPAAGLTAGFELADELRAVGAHVLLIDARLDSPVLDTLFADGFGGGLAQVMTGEVVLDRAVRTLSGLDGLDLLTVGTVTGETAGHLTGAPFHRLLSEARLNYHSIVIIGDAITAAGPDDVIDVERSRALAAAVDGLIVGTNDTVGTAASAELADLLGSLDAPTLQLIAAPAAPAAPADDTTVEASSV